VDTDGENAAKKKWVVKQLNNNMPIGDKAHLIKKTGSLGNAVELAINVFKYGGSIFGIGKKVINALK